MNKKPILAICYDFDKTLSPNDMQAQGYIQSIDYDVSEFWKQSNQLAAENDMDQNLAYMYMMLDRSRGRVLFTKETLHENGRKVQLFPGVRTWFDRINQYGADKGVEVEHYIISSGLKEMIEGTEVADKFTKIYASSFYFDNAGVAVWPAQVVNYTNKTQFLFRIEKGVLDVNNQGVNSYFEPNQYRVPFRNMVYIGDSDTDIPCMKLVNINGGHSIGVYNSETKDKSKVFKMLDENRIKYFAPADYTEGSKLECLIKRIIDRTISNEILESIHYDCISEKKEENATPEKESESREKKDVHDERGSGKAHKTPRKRKKPVKAFGKLIRKLSQKLREILEKIKCTWKNLCDKIKNIADKKDKILEFLEQENHKAAFARGKKELVWVKRFLKPKKLRVKLHFGFEDPYHTGQVLALCGMFYAFIGENMDLEPDFEKRVLEGSVYVKGRLRTVHMAVFAAKMLLDKNIRSTYHDIREFKW